MQAELDISISLFKSSGESAKVFILKAWSSSLNCKKEEISFRNWHNFLVLLQVSKADFELKKVLKYLLKLYIYFKQGCGVGIFLGDSRFPVPKNYRESGSWKKI